MEKLNNPKPLFSRNEESKISKEVKENCSCIRGQIMPTRNNNRRKSICVSRPLKYEISGKIKFAQSKRFRPEHSLPNRKK